MTPYYSARVFIAAIDYENILLDLWYINYTCSMQPE